MPKLLVFQHVAYEILGTLDPLLRSYGFRNQYVNFGRSAHRKPCLAGYHGLAILGGPMSVDDVEKHPHLETEVRVIREAIDRDIPVLGICLGAQLIAKALGAEVRPNPVKEIGWYDVSLSPEGREDPLFAGFREEEKIFQWHGDTFDIPEGAVALASSETCPNQAFRYGDRVYGLQFHLEVDERLIERWLGVPHHQAEIESMNGETDAERIRRDTSRHVGRGMQLSDLCFTEFARLFGNNLRQRNRHPHG